jgi:hypothetical protein
MLEGLAKRATNGWLLVGFVLAFTFFIIARLDEEPPTVPPADRVDGRTVWLVTLELAARACRPRLGRDEELRVANSICSGSTLRHNDIEPTGLGNSTIT